MTADALLDLSVLERLLQGDRQQMRKFADKFIQTAARDLDQIAAALAAGEHDQLRHLGHRARSAALTVGAAAMASLYLHLERLPSDPASALSVARKLLDELEAALQHTTTSLRAAGL